LGSSGVAEVLHALAGGLPDEALLEIFPDQDASSIRAALQEAARLIGILEDGTGSDHRQPAAIPKAEETGWEPRCGKIALYTDGAARGNPGEAGAGILLLDEQGREIAAKSSYLGRCTNNVAEYRALILGLQEAGKYSAGEIVVHLDAELLVRQLLGRYQVRDKKLKNLHAQVLGLLSGFKSYRILHVPRDANRRADFLANRGIDQKKKLTEG
jgi:ribonuclease HI